MFPKSPERLFEGSRSSRVHALSAGGWFSVAN
jgi:hypothetical protein